MQVSLRICLLIVGLIDLSVSARGDVFTWNGTAGTTELWSSASNWSPAGPPGTNDTSAFDSGSSLLHDVVMSPVDVVAVLDMIDGRYEFRRTTGSATPWLLQVGLGSGPSGDRFRVAEGGSEEVELTLRDGILSTQDFGIAEGNNSSGTVIATNMELAADNIWLARGDDSEGLLRFTNGSLSVVDEIEIGAGGDLEILGSAVADLADNAGGSLVSSGNFLVAGTVTSRLLRFEDGGSFTIAQDGEVTAEELSMNDFSTLTIQGSGGNQARLEVGEATTSLGAQVTIGNLGFMRADSLQIGGPFNLQLGGRLEVFAHSFAAGGPSFNWTGGTLAFQADLRINASPVSLESPFGQSLTVSSGRTLEVDGEIRIGPETQGALTISGGTVTSGAARIGAAGLPTGPATVALSGSSGSWTVAGNLTAGGLPNQQTVTINVSGGADLNVGNAFVAPSGLLADITVDGTGSTFTSTNSVYLGGNATTAGGQGTLALTSGGALGIGNSATDVLKVWEGYAVTMNQASIDTRDLTVRGSIAPAVGAIIPGNITVSGTTNIDGGSVTLTALSSNLVATGNVTVQNGGTLNAYINGGSGTNVAVTGAGSTWTTPNVVANVLGTSTSGVGRIRQLTISPGGTVNFGAGVSYAAGAVDGLTMAGGTLNAPTFNGGTVGFTGRGTVNATYTGSGPIQATGALLIGNAGTVNGFATTGQISVGANTLTLNDLDAAQLGSGTIMGFSGAPGTLIAANGLAVGSGETVFGFGTINTPNNAAKRLTNDGSMSGTGTAQRLTLTGDVTGTGSFSNVEFTGTLSPGNPTFGLTTALVSGSNYKFTETSNLVMDILGANPGFGYDVIFSTGQFIADGTLTVNLINGYSPTLGQTFDMLDFTTLTGTFDTLDLPPLDPGLFWDTSQLYIQGVLSVMSGFLEADFEEDGDVDGNDLVRWQNKYGETGLAHDEGDADGDGDADGRDFLIWQRQYTGPLPLTAEATAVPEPVGAVLLLAGCVGIVALGRK